MKEVHPEAKPVCTKCKLRFPNKTGYEVNIYKKHNKKFQCPQCSKSTGDLLKLKKHMEEKHTTKKTSDQETREVDPSPTTTIEDIPVNTVECFICGHTDINQEELNKHMEMKHIQQVQTLKCKKCNFEAKDINSIKENESNMAHNMASKDKACTNGNLSQYRWARQGRCMFRHEKEPAPNVGKVKECRNGETCKFKAQGQCYHYHINVGVQKVKPNTASVILQTNTQSTSMPPAWQERQQQQTIPPTQSSHTQSRLPAPWTQWQTVPPMWRPIQQQQFLYPPPSPPTKTAQAWCTHGKACNLGRYCLLRHFSDKDFLQLQSQT